MTRLGLVWGAYQGCSRPFSLISVIIVDPGLAFAKFAQLQQCPRMPKLFYSFSPWWSPLYLPELGIGLLVYAKDGTGTVITRVTVRKRRGGYPRNRKAIRWGILNA